MPSASRNCDSLLLLYDQSAKPARGPASQLELRHLPERLEIQGRATFSSGDHQPIQPEFPGKNGERLKAADKDDVDEDGDTDTGRLILQLTYLRL